MRNFPIVLNTQQFLLQLKIQFHRQHTKNSLKFVDRKHGTRQILISKRKAKQQAIENQLKKSSFDTKRRKGPFNFKFKSF